MTDFVDPSSQPSKSQRKRDHLGLQALADELIQLSDNELATVVLSDELRQEVVNGRGLTRGAYKRQIRFVAKLLAVADAATIRAAVNEFKRTSHQAAARLHRLERWRERLVAQGDEALEALVVAYPEADRQHLRQLVRKVHAERQRGAPPRGYRSLFRYLRDLDDVSATQTAPDVVSPVSDGVPSDSAPYDGAPD